MAAQLDITAAADIAGRLVLTGELDTHTSPQLARHLDGVDPTAAIELDLTAITFISSAGLSVILNAQRRHRDHGGSLVVAAADTNVARTIELSGLADVLGLSETDGDS